jgi:glycosyltransferase-like protein
VTVWSLGRGGDEGFYRPVDPSVQVRIVPFPDISDEGVGPRILRSIATMRAAFSDDFDIVHAQDCISANAVDRCVRTVHHIDHFTTPELASCHERAIVRPYAHLCVSAAVADELAAGWGIQAQVIPNGVDAARFASATGMDVWRQRLGRYVLSVGGIEPRKGSIELLEAYAKLGIPDVSLVIAGGETLFDYRAYRAQWEQRAADLGCSPVVLGPVAHEALPSLVAAAEVFVFPSTKEGFGLAAMEAAAAGVPLVTSDLPVFRELFDGVAWFADDLTEAIRTALTTPDTQRIEAGRQLAARYTWAAAAQRHIAFYHSLRP